MKCGEQKCRRHKAVRAWLTVEVGSRPVWRWPGAWQPWDAFISLHKQTEWSWSETSHWPSVFAQHPHSPFLPHQVSFSAFPLLWCRSQSDWSSQMFLNVRFRQQAPVCIRENSQSGWGGDQSEVRRTWAKGPGFCPTRSPSWEIYIESRGRVLASLNFRLCLSVCLCPSIHLLPSPRPLHTMRVTSLTQRSLLGLGIPRTPVTYPIRAAPCSSPVPGASYLEVTDVILAFSTWWKSHKGKVFLLTLTLQRLAW